MLSPSEPKPHSPTGKRRASGRQRAAQVVDALNQLCITLGPGGRIPTHTELMGQFGASERAVREALDAFHRSGRIIRRPGAGTFVAEPPAAEVAERTAPTAAGLPSSLVSGRSIVAVAATDHSFFDRSVGLFCRYAETSGYAPICRPIQDADQIDVVGFGRSLLDATIGGVIVFGSYLEPLARYLYQNGARVVHYVTPPPDVAVPTVGGDQEFGGYLMTEHLIGLGHRRIAFGHGMDCLRWTGLQRAVRKAQRNGMPMEIESIERELELWQEDPARAAAYLRAPGAPTAILCWNDEKAVRLISVLNRIGMRVPEEVSVTGYDNLPESRIAVPALTTIDPSADQMVRMAIDLIDREEPLTPSRTLLVPSLVVRESTAPPPQSTR